MRVCPKLENNVSPEQRAVDRAWSYQASKHYLAQCSADKETLAERSENLDKAFAKAEKALGDGPCFKGFSLCNVDIAWLPLLHRAAIIKRYSGYDFLAQYPKVRAWQTALLETGLAERSVADDFEAAFTDFYLSDKSYLGRGESCSSSTANTGCC